MKKNPSQLSTVSVNGQEVPIFGSLESKSLAIVDLEILKRITGMMPTMSFYDLKQNFVNEVRNTDTIAQFTNVLENELRFHKTVNDIEEYQPEQSYDSIPVAV